MTVPVDIQYYKAIVDAQDEAAKIAARHEAHGNRVQDYAAGKLARAYVTIKRYKPKAKIYHEFTVTGRDCYFSETAHSIFAAVLAELEAGRHLHTSTIANMTGASRGYVSKVISLLYRLGFITILERIRGRWGRIVASIVNVSSLPRRSIYREETLNRRVPLYPGWGVGSKLFNDLYAELEALW